MASIGFLIGGALINALAFTGSNFLFSSLSKESIDKERKRHDKAIEDLQRAQTEWRDYKRRVLAKKFPLYTYCHKPYHLPLNHLNKSRFADSQM